MFPHLKQHRSSSSSSLVLWPLPFVSLKPILHQNLLRKSSAGAPRFLYLTSAEESEWIQEKHGGDACVTDAPSLPCSAVHRASWKLPERRERKRGRETKFPRSPHTFPWSIVFLFVRTLFPLGSRSRSLCPRLYYVRSWVDLAKFWKGWSLCSGLILRLIW